MSILNIENFRQTIAPGFQRPNKFLVQFPIPPLMASAGVSGGTPLYATLQNIQYYADSCDLVGVGVGTVNIIRYGYGASEKVPFAPLFNDILMTFYEDVNNNNLIYFQSWLSVIQNWNMSQGIAANFATGGLSAYESSYKDDYAVDGTITLLNELGEGEKSWRPRKMFPVQIAETKLAWGLRDVMRISVIFNYMDWYGQENMVGTESGEASTVLNSRA